LSAIARSPALQVECVRIALANVAATALRAENAEQALAGGPLTDEAIAAKAMSICDKIEMAGPMVRRAQKAVIGWRGNHEVARHRCRFSASPVRTKRPQ